MGNYCSDIGWKSINHDGEELCGDHVDIVEPSENSRIIVLADGLGSGVKACILSTLTSKIISTMMANNRPLEECVETITATLPICSIRGIAYSTFTILHLVDHITAELIQYDNPRVILLRNGCFTEYQMDESVVNGKKVYKSSISLQENDVFIMMSDGCTHAGIGRAYNFGWKRQNIAAYLGKEAAAGCSAKRLSALLIEECIRQYGGHPGDDATACVVRICPRMPVRLLFGPPQNAANQEPMLSQFFDGEGKRIICGGSTAQMAAAYLKKPLRPSLVYERADIPPMAELDGAELVTEGFITISRVIAYAKDALAENECCAEWQEGRDGASMVAQMLFEKATDIHFYVGQAVNPAYQNPDIPLPYNIKMNLVEELSECLRQMGKQVSIRYY